MWDSLNCHFEMCPEQLARLSVGVHPRRTQNESNNNKNTGPSLKTTVETLFIQFFCQKVQHKKKICPKLGNLNVELHVSHMQRMLHAIVCTDDFQVGYNIHSK